MKPVVILLAGHAPDAIRARHGDFPSWFCRAARLPKSRVRVVNIAAEEALPDIDAIAGAIITGSGAMVTDRLAWSEQTALWIRGAVDRSLPLFGVCYGHQLMAHALGGRVDYLPGGREIGTQLISRCGQAATDRAVQALPSTFRAHTTHEQAVLQAPASAQVLARSARDPHQVLRYGPHALSTQFHPEFSAEVMRAYVLRKLTAHRRADALRLPTFRDTAATPVARGVLRQFAQRHGWTLDA
ncbi:MAG: glutamine amidotransferase [Rhodanobacter sp.]